MHGEELEDTVIREVFEKTGKKLEIERLLCIHQNFFKGNNTCDCHEVAFYYLMKKTDDNLISEGILSDGKRETTIWVDIADFKKINTHLKWLPDMIDSKEVKTIVTYQK